MLTLIFGIRASESPRAWRMTEKAGPDRVKGFTTFSLKWFPNFQSAFFSISKLPAIPNFLLNLMENKEVRIFFFILHEPNEIYKIMS